MIHLISDHLSQNIFCFVLKDLFFCQKLMQLFLNLGCQFTIIILMTRISSSTSIRSHIIIIIIQLFLIMGLQFTMLMVVIISTIYPQQNN